MLIICSDNEYFGNLLSVWSSLPLSGLCQPFPATKSWYGETDDDDDDDDYDDDDDDDDDDDMMMMMMMVMMIVMVMVMVMVMVIIYNPWECKGSRIRYIRSRLLVGCLIIKPFHFINVIFSLLIWYYYDKKKG